MTALADLSTATASAPSRRVPDFFVVGQFKSGTTALYEMLRQHPQIYLPELKEVWYHSPELRAQALARRSQTRPATLEGYQSLFDGARPDQRVGEATPSYLISRGAARSIADLQPDARIIAIFREPASFLRSFHLQCVENHTENEPDLRKALELVEGRRAGKSIPANAARPLELLYTDHIRYVEQIRRYYELFPPEHVLVLIYEDFRRDNESTVRQVLRFLDVDDTRQVELVEANPTVRVRAPRLDQFIRSLYLGRGAASGAGKRAAKALVPERLRRSSLRVMRRQVMYTTPRPPDEELMAELRHRFKREVVALGEYLDRDLVTLWGYDGLG
jgi:Sulfotransferase domain